MGTCAIPVVLANNWSLPFAPLVDWRKAAIVLEERYARDPSALLDMLPADPEVIRRMRAEVCAISDRFFSTEERRARGFLLSAKALMAARRRRKSKAGKAWTL